MAAQPALPRQPYVLVDACAYCFGAAATTAMALERLDPEIPCVFVGGGSSLEFLGDHPRFATVLSADTQRWSDLLRLERAFAGAAACFVNTNAVMAIHARDRGVPVVLLDIIPWLQGSIGDSAELARELHDNRRWLGSRPDAEALLAGVESFLAQSYLLPFELDPAIEHPHLIPPILPPAASAPPRREIGDNTLVVSLGGLFNPDADGEVLAAFAAAVATAACRAARRAGVAEVILAGPDRLRDLVAERDRAPRLRVGHLAHEELLAALAGARFAAIAPGLTSIYETFAIGTPTLLLPCTNFSQLLQLRAVAARDLGGDLAVGGALGERLAAIADRGEVEGTRAVVRALGEGLADGTLAATLDSGFAALAASSRRDPIVGARRALLEDLGVDGAAHAAAAVEAAWRGRLAGTAG